MQILKMANTNMTIFGYLGSETPQSFGTQIYLYPIMQVLGNKISALAYIGSQAISFLTFRRDNITDPYG